MIGGAVNIAKKHQKRLDTVRLIMGANLNNLKKITINDTSN